MMPFFRSNSSYNNNHFIFKSRPTLSSEKDPLAAVGVSLWSRLIIARRRDRFSQGRIRVSWKICNEGFAKSPPESGGAAAPEGNEERGGVVPFDVARREPPDIFATA